MHPCAHPQVHDLSHYPPPTLLQFSAAPHTLLIGSSGAHPQICCAPNRGSNPIAHRVRRKHQRLPPSLLIENASDRVPLRCESVLPEAFPIKPSDNSPVTGKRPKIKRGRGSFRYHPCVRRFPTGLSASSKGITGQGLAGAFAEDCRFLTSATRA
jgi:hypothetical protein